MNQPSSQAHRLWVRLLYRPGLASPDQGSLYCSAHSGKPLLRFIHWTDIARDQGLPPGLTFVLIEITPNMAQGTGPAEKPEQIMPTLGCWSPTSDYCHF